MDKIAQFLVKKHQDLYFLKALFCVVNHLFHLCINLNIVLNIESFKKSLTNAK